MPRRKKEEFVSETSNVNLNNISIMNGYVVVQLDGENSNLVYVGEVAGVGSINPLQLSIGEKVLFDQTKIAPLGGNLYALKFDDIIAREHHSESKKLLLEEQEQKIEEEPIQEEYLSPEPKINQVAPIQNQFQVPAVNPPSYNITRSFHPKGNKPTPSTGVKHMDKPIRK